MAELSKVLGFNSEAHRRVLAGLMGRKNSGTLALTSLYRRWQRDEEQYLGYIKETDVDTRNQYAREQGESEYKTIHIPYNYAMLMAAHTYITSTMFARNPIWQVQGRHGEPQMNEMAWEALLDYQVTVGGHMPAYYVWTHDALRYGHGVLGQYWCERYVKTSKVEDAPMSFLGIPVPGTGRPKRTTTMARGYAGMEVFNVKPSQFYWDPRYPVHSFQKGEFCGREYELNELDLEAIDYTTKKPRYFNVKEARDSAHGKGMRDANRQSSVMDQPSQNKLPVESYELATRNLQIDEIMIRLSPKDWGLGSDSMPEKWVFTVVEEQVIVEARPLGLYHDMFPYSIVPAEVEGYDRVPRGILYMTEALNETLSWLVNTHFYNVRRALNDQLVVDPSRVMMSDFMGPNPGRLARLKPTAYGSDVRTIVSQIPVADVTRTNVNDMSQIADMMQRILGINDTIMGSINTGRRTATEVRSSTTFGINRLKTMVEFMSAAAFSPHTQMMMQTTQQMMDYALKLKVIGDLPRSGTAFVDVTPETISGFYDMVPIDGTLPVDRLAQMNLWQQMFQAIVKIPQITQGFDLPGVFSWVAKLGGLRNIDRFRVNVLPPGTAPPAGTMPIEQLPSANGLDNSGAPTGPQPSAIGPMQ